MWHVRFGMQATPPVILTSCQGVKWTSQLQVVLRLGLNIFLEPWVKEKLFFISLPRLAIWMCLGAGLILFPYYMKKYGKDMPLPLLQNVSSHHRCASRSWSIDPISARMWILGQGCSWDDDEKHHQPDGKCLVWFCGGCQPSHIKALLFILVWKS